MATQRKRAVSPIIAILLLIAIAVAAGIIVYTFVGSLAGNLTKSGGNQVTEQVSMDAYSFQKLAGPTVYLRDTGSTAITIVAVYFDGVPCSDGGACTSVTFSVNTLGQCGGTPTAPVCSSGETTTATLTVVPQAAGSSHAVKFVTSDGAEFVFNLVAGQVG